MAKTFKFDKNKNIKPVMKGLQAHVPAKVISDYRNRLVNLTKRMTSDTEKQIKQLFNSRVSTKYFKKTDQQVNDAEKSSKDLVIAYDESIASTAKRLMSLLNKKYSKIFKEKADIYANDMVADLTAQSHSYVKRSLKQLSGGLVIKAPKSTAIIDEATAAIIQQNIELITSIPEEYLKNVQGDMMRSIASGNLEDLNDIVSPNAAVSTRKANNKAKHLAEDQVRKSYNAITAHRLINNGIDKFEWLHSGGGQHPRQDHIDMDGNIYSFKDLPIIDQRTGETGIPGQAINCRCTMNPVVEFSDNEIEEAA